MRATPPSLASPLRAALASLLLAALASVLGAVWPSSPASAQAPMPMTEGGARFVALGDLPGGAFASSAADVSADGRTIVGEGVNSQGEPETWLAVLP